MIEIIIFDTDFNHYDIFQINQNFILQLACPACASPGTLKRHSVYMKSCDVQSILILCLKCTVCCKHHALIPSFSMPNTMISTHKAHEYIRLTRNGMSKKLAGKQVFGDTMSVNYYCQFEKMNARCCNNAKALLPFQGDHLKHGIDFILTLQEVSSNTPILDFNRYCLTIQLNCIFASRADILDFGILKSADKYSNKTRTPAKNNNQLDSC